MYNRTTARPSPTSTSRGPGIWTAPDGESSDSVELPSSTTTACAGDQIGAVGTRPSTLGVRR